jgi:CheY-like chemotaxis protein
LARKILLADDSVTAQNMGRKILADAGYEVITVNNGSAALKKIAEVKPDLIVLDVYMPGYSGLEVCQRLKETQESARTPVLLTVGKLEPFKPEEAKRVRADGFIVKPFEASELLSALTKLEDKIVPRAEASKPGRFARSIAAIEEGGYDRTMAVEEDSGWKNRIGFPSDKKKAAEKENGDDPAIYNAVNKDLRTVVDPGPARTVQTVHDAPTADFRVDLGALAPAGLPKDVTPEEIAALAAAAAQVQGSIAASKKAESAPEPPIAIEKGAAHVGQEEAKTQEAPKEKIETPAPDAATPAAVPDAIPAAIPETIPEPSPAHVAAAIASLEPSREGAGDGGSGNGTRPDSVADEAADQPVTMAVAARAESSETSRGTASRWTAVASALAPEEAAISLESEMQKAHAAFAAAEGAHTRFAATSSMASPAAVEETKVSETPAPVESAAAPVQEVAQTLEEVASVAKDAISAAVQELEAVAASYEAQARVQAESNMVEAPVSSTANAVVDSQMHAVATHEPQPADETKEIAQAEVASQDLAVVHVSAIEPAADLKVEDQRREETAVAGAEPIAETHVFETSSEALPEEKGSTATAEPHRHQKSSSPESDMAETTAAAWASWRRIRESGDSPTASAHPSETVQEKTPESNFQSGSGDAGSQYANPHDAAAMAVAAGAEKTPDEGSAASDAEVASIVDSVLADLRPKIVEEISRKLGKKK